MAESGRRTRGVTIADPIHGSIGLSGSELAVLDSRPLQRLRAVKQLGFSEYAFPGATHSRLSHSLGAMQMATHLFDHLLRNCEATLSAASSARFRQAVRLAMVCHDLGHPPLSHVSERMMPMLQALQLPADIVSGQSPTRQATHEDYTLKLLVESPLREIIDELFVPEGVGVDELAALITGDAGLGASPFVENSVDWLPALHAIISGELDADRMDYLRRDAHNCGVSYGEFDHHWLAANLTAVVDGGALRPALKHKAVWAFEHFLLARYHMFLAVYYHHTSVCFEQLLGRYFAGGEYVLPSDTEAYLQTDDVQLWWALRQSRNPYAQAVCERRPWALALETHEFAGEGDLRVAFTTLRDQGIEAFVTESRTRLSRYFDAGSLPLYVLEPERARVRPIAAYTPLYERFAAGANIARVYCRPPDLERARAALRNALQD